jgi:hypothetical protein
MSPKVGSILGADTEKRLALLGAETEKRLARAAVNWKEFGPEKAKELLGEGVEYLEFSTGSFEADVGDLDLQVGASNGGSSTTCVR